MKRIGVSQRLDKVSGREEYRDALDSRWADLLWSLGYVPILLSSRIENLEDYFDALHLDAVLLTGGNDLGLAQDRDRLEKFLLDYAKLKSLPVLGVCRGMQMLNHYFGGQLAKVREHVATRHSLVGAWAERFGFLEVNSFHNEAILPEGLAIELEVLASAKGDVIEAIRHRDLPWLGIMWHPEREVPYRDQDLKLITSLFGE